MPIDPTIFLRAYQGGADPVEQIQRAAALREQQRRGQLTDLQIQGEKMKLADMSRQQQKSLALDDAIKGAYQTPAPQTTQAAPVDVGGVSIPQPSSTVQGPPQVNQGMLLSKVGQVDPMAAMSMQSQFTKQKQDQDAATAAMMEKLSQADLNTQKSASEHLGIFGQKAMFFSQLPPEQKAQLYPSFKQDLEQNHFVPQGSLPDQYGPQVDQIMHASILEGQKVKDTLDQQLTAAGQKQTAENNAATQKHAADTLAETTRHNKADEYLKGQEANGSAGQLTPEAKNKLATMFATTGQLPSLGMGKAGASMRADIMNQAAKDYPSVDFASNAAAYKANKDSLTNVTRTLDTLTAFENTSIKNLKQFTDLADKIPDTGIPWLNQPVRELSRTVVGDTNMAAVEAARNVALREIARVTNDPKLSGVLSDSARKEVSDLNPMNATIPQIKAVSKVLIQDMANVHKSLSDQKDAITGRIGINQDARIDGSASAPVINKGTTGSSVDITLPSGKKITIN